MRKAVLIVLLVLFVAMPVGAMANKKWENVCVGVNLTVYGEQVQVVPEQCVRCWYMLCGWAMDQCPPQICSSQPTAIHLGPHHPPGQP